VASVTNSYVTVGSGDHHVLAIHGWFGSAGGWGSLPEWLDGSAYAWAFMNLRGYGDRQDVAGEFTVDEAAADALAVADDLGWDRFSVVGHSMGAKFGHRMLLAAPDRVRALVGLNAVPAGAVPFDEDGWALFSGAPAEPGNRAAIIDFTTGNKLTRTFIDHIVRNSLDNSTVEAFAAYLQAWAKSDFTAQAKVDTATPVKLIVGVNDPAMSANVMEQTWRVFFPEAELTILPDAGHYPMFESPVSLATSIEEFLGRA
jgi:pimeloyl-ACP methyl ester carboxylesterase